MTGGSIVRADPGRTRQCDRTFNLPYVEAIRARLGRRIPIVMITESQPIDNVRRFRRTRA
jgi:hypothetical protein